MSYRSLLVMLDQDPLGAARTAVAIRLAKDFDCHLTGVAPTGLLDMPVVPEAAAAYAELATLAWETMQSQARDAAERFRTACRAAGLKSFDAIVDEADIAASLVRHAHCSDLTVLTQADPDASGHRATQAALEQMVLHSARPTLILPYAGQVTSLGSKVMVAWDDSREAARALADALPLLRRAARVQVVAWHETGDEDRALRRRLDDVHRWLMWQGVSAEVAVETTEIGIAEAMLSRAAELEVDLVVMGAYGHARWTERVLGGATRGLLAAMTVPVLMSH